MSQPSDCFIEKEVKKSTRGPAKPLTKPEIQEILHYLQISSTAINLKSPSSSQAFTRQEEQKQEKDLAEQHKAV
jgi:hypothetical protein